MATEMITFTPKFGLLTRSFVMTWKLVENMMGGGNNKRVQWQNSVLFASFTEYGER